MLLYFLQGRQKINNTFLFLGIWFHEILICSMSSHLLLLLFCFVFNLTLSLTLILTLSFEKLLLYGLGRLNPIPFALGNSSFLYGLGGWTQPPALTHRSELNIQIHSIKIAYLSPSFSGGFIVQTGPISTFPVMWYKNIGRK